MMQVFLRVSFIGLLDLLLVGKSLPFQALLNFMSAVQHL